MSETMEGIRKDLLSIVPFELVAGSGVRVIGGAREE